ncbi:alpha/beta fold hydrolase [Herbiconiux sp. P15]|uniref:alpha/beta fold hydrolase n=1 Tax=Herbiconiux liukaitaii TaxID=3342799 RepID=UPI0035BB0084
MRPDGVAVAWEALGDAAHPVVLLVHGFASSREGNWLRARWAEPLLEAGFRVVTADLRGHGESGRPRALAAYGLARFRGDLVAVLDAASTGGHELPGEGEGEGTGTGTGTDTGAGTGTGTDTSTGTGTGTDAVHVIGYSLGARLAWDLALRHPQRVRSLVLGGAPVTGSFAGFDHAAALSALAESDDQADAAPADAVTARYLRMARGVPGNDPHALVRVAEAMRRHGFDPAARVPRQPMLFVVGADDDLAPAVRETAARIPHADFVELPGRDHLSAVTSGVFKQAAVGFLQRAGEAHAASAPPG